MRLIAAALVAGFALGAPAAATAATDPHLTQAQVIDLFLAEGKVADWVDRYPPDSLLPSATFRPGTGDWAVAVWSTVRPPAIELAKGVVDDRTGEVTEAWTGPQVAWTGLRGVTGDRQINRTPVWLAFCAVFLLGLADFRRLASLRNLDLLVLLSFSISLFYYNDGRIFTSMPLAYPPLLYLLARMAWTGWRGRSPGSSPPVWPVWALAAALVVLTGVRIGLTVHDSYVVDVGQAGVVGAHVIAQGETPYGHVELEHHRADTYGPVAYYAYLPAYAAVGWSGNEAAVGEPPYREYGWQGREDGFDASRVSSILFDVLCLIGLALVGYRFGGARLGATLPFAWAAYPFTQHVLTLSTNDALMPALLVFGFYFVSAPAARGAFAALAGWTKFAALAVAPLWATYPDVTGRLRPKAIFGTAFVLTTLAVFWVLLLDGDPLHAVRVFWDKTLGWQLGRQSPLSVWDWGYYRAEGLPDLHVIQRVLQVAVLIGIVAVAFWPRRKSPLQLAALTAAVLIAVQVVTTHWFYDYIPWFFPFVAFAVLAAPRPATSVDG